MAEDVETLRACGADAHVIEDGSRFYVVVRGFRLPDARYRPAVTDLMVVADYQYPVSKLDMYWTDPAIYLVSGALPQAAETFENYAGRRWQRWSWHYPTWDPSRHNLVTHIEVFHDRLARGS